MSRITDAVAKWLIAHNAISADDKESYEYAVFCFLITATPIILVMIFGAILSIFLQSVIFILPFVLLRKFSGGFHLKSLTACLILSATLIFAFLFAIKYLTNINIILPLSIVVFLSIISLIYFSPIDSEARKLSDIEKKVFQKVVLVLTVIIGSIYLVLAMTGAHQYAISIAGGILLTAFLQVPCIIKKFKSNTINTQSD